LKNSVVKVSHSQMVLRPTYPYQLPFGKATHYGRDFVAYCVPKKFLEFLVCNVCYCVFDCYTYCIVAFQRLIVAFQLISYTELYSPLNAAVGIPQLASDHAVGWTTCNGIHCTAAAIS